jgi:predicted nuclease with TOPRIM domain
MSLKKIAAGFILPFLLTSLLCSQSVVELAKNEKLRRTRIKLQGKRGKVVTKADLKSIKRGAALTTTLSLTSTSSSRSQIVTSTPEESPAREEQPTEVQTNKQKDQEIESLKALQVQLEEQWENAKDNVNILSRKLNTLWKQFYSIEDLSARENVQAEISKTSEQLQTAKGQETSSREELRKVVAALRIID